MARSTLLLITMMSLLIRRVMNQGEIVQNLIANAIMLTAQLANEVTIQTKGEFLVPESDYLHLVKEFQVRLAKRIMPVRTQEDIKEEAKKFIAEIIKNSQSEDNSGTSDSGTNTESSIDIPTGE